MKAIVTHGFGAADVLEITEIPTPGIGADDVLIRVTASGLNGADLLQRRGLYPAPAGASPLLGMEVSGIIEAIGHAVVQRGLKPGDRVIALLPGGGYAAQVAVRHDQVMLLPEGLDLVAAGGIAEVFLTAYLELRVLGKLHQGQKLLIHAGASGVGTAAIQLARRAGAEIWVTASSDAKLKACEELGAHHLINYKTQDFAEVIHEQTHGVGMDCILDLVGAAHFPGNLQALALEGKLLLVGMGGGAKSEVDLRLMLAKRLQLIGSTLRARTEADKARLIHEFWTDSKISFGNGVYRPVVDKVFRAHEVRAAHQYMESQANVGKILLQW